MLLDAAPSDARPLIAPECPPGLLVDVTARPETGYSLWSDSRWYAGCIERRNWRGTITTLPVWEYEKGRSFVRRLSSDRAITFHGLGWATFAPPVEQLGVEWLDLDGKAGFRVADWETYAWQMRRHFGICEGP